MTKKHESLTVQLPADLNRRLDAIKKRLGVPKVFVIRQGLDMALAQFETHQEAERTVPENDERRD